MVITPVSARNRRGEPGRSTVQTDLYLLARGERRAKSTGKNQAMIAGNEVTGTRASIITDLLDAYHLAQERYRGINDHHLAAANPRRTCGTHYPRQERVNPICEGLTSVVVGIGTTLYLVSVMPGDTPIKRDLYPITTCQCTQQRGTDHQRWVVSYIISGHATVGRDATDVHRCTRQMVDYRCSRHRTIATATATATATHRHTTN